MKRWQRIGLLGIAIALFLGGTVFFVLKNRGLVSPVGKGATVVTPSPTPSLMSWEDPAGFRFQYPAGVTMDTHPEDTQNYAHIELTSPTHPGKLIVWVKDPPLDKAGNPMVDVGKWVSTQKRFAAGTILDTTLGGQEAKKVRLTSPDELITASVYDDLLVTIEASLEDLPFWSGLHEAISTSFAFVPATQNNAAGSESSTAEVAADEEEVLQ